MWAKHPLGPLSSGSKDHGTHNIPLFPGWNFVLFQLGKILCFKPWLQKLKGLGKSTCTSNVPEDEACLDTKLVESACGDQPEIPDGMPNSSDLLPPKFFMNLRCPPTRAPTEATTTEVEQSKTVEKAKEPERSTLVEDLIEKS